MNKVLIITYYWPPAGGPGVQRWLKFARYLPDFNVTPVILTVHPQKATYPLRDDSLQHEVSADVEVHYTNTFEPFGVYQKATGRSDVPFSGFANESAKPGPRQKLAKFIRGNFFLPDARKGWNKHAISKAQELLSKGGFKAIITTGPPHSTHLIGRALKRQFGIRWLADFRDPWTDIYYYKELFPTALATAIDKKMERSVLLEADVVIPVSHDMQRILLEKSPRLTREKFSMLPNGYDDVDFENWVKSPSDIFTITYAGTLTQQYKMGTFLRVLDTMAKALPIRLVLAGKYDEVVANQLKSLTHVEVVNQGYITHKAVIELLGKTDALLLALPDLPGYTGILPGKLFEYLATQQPILCLGTTSSDAAKIIAQAKAGETCTYDDESALNKTLLAWVKRWQQNEKPVVNTGFIKQFSRKALTQQLSALILQ